MPLLLIDAKLDKETNRWGATIGFPGGATLVSVGALSSREEALRIAMAGLAVLADNSEILHAVTALPVGEEVPRQAGSAWLKHPSLTTFTEFVLSGSAFAVCGYWLRSLDRTGDHEPYSVTREWLVYEMTEDAAPPSRQVAVEALLAWTNGQPLPPRVMVLDAGACERAWDHAALTHGIDWYARGGGGAIDEALQWALLGEVRYG